MTPFDLFMFFYNEYSEIIANFTNENMQKNKNYSINSITKDDMIKYIFIFIYLSIYDFPEIEMLWEKSKFFKSIIPNIISKNKYITINKFFSISKY